MSPLYIDSVSCNLYHFSISVCWAIWKCLYKTSSGTNGGTLYQLRNLLTRRNVTAKIKSDPTACEEFFILVLEAHILTIAMKKFGLESFDDTPSIDLFGEEFTEKTPSDRMDVFNNAVKGIVTEFTNFFNTESLMEERDHILAYANELLSFGMLYLEFVDSIREGDGHRILRCWRYLLLIFKATNKRKYAIQASTLLFQYHYIFSERLQNQLIWSRTVNVSGRPGRNIPMDFHMEHLNRELKQAIGHLKSNISETSINRIGRCLQKLVNAKANYDSCSDVPSETSYHSSRSLSKDLKRVVQELKSCEIYNRKSDRQHSQFPNIKGNTVSVLDKSELELWLKKQLTKLLTYL